HEYNRSTTQRHISYFAKAFSLERNIPDRQHLINDQYFRFEVGRHGKREADIHARAVTLHGRVEEFLNLRKVYNLIEPGSNFCSAHSENGRIQVDILPAGQVLVKAGADLE